MVFDIELASSLSQGWSPCDIIMIVAERKFWWLRDSLQAGKWMTASIGVFSKQISQGLPVEQVDLMKGERMPGNFPDLFKDSSFAVERYHNNTSCPAGRSSSTYGSDITCSTGDQYFHYCRMMLSAVSIHSSR